MKVTATTVIALLSLASSTLACQSWSPNRTDQLVSQKWTAAELTAAGKDVKHAGRVRACCLRSIAERTSDGSAWTCCTGGHGVKSTLSVEEAGSKYKQGQGAFLPYQLCTDEPAPVKY
jgi:hypothetical protein